MVESNIAKSGDEHRKEIKKGQIGHRTRREDHLPALPCRVAEKRMFDGLPMFGRRVGVTGGTKNRWREKKQDDDDRAEEDRCREDEQKFVPADDGKGTFH